jgi:hypothetical protein
MKVFGLILNGEGLDPASYNGSMASSEFTAEVYGASNEEDTQKVAEDLAARGAAFINLCGDYTADQAAALSRHLNGLVKVSYVKYSPDQTRKLEELTDFSEYGFIVHGEGFHPQSHSLRLEAPGCNTRMVGAETMEEAKEAARQMEREGIFFIELCGAFTGEMTKQIIQAVGGRVPVGSAGLDK